MQDFSQQGHRRAAQLGLADSMDSEPDDDDVNSSAHIHPKPKGASSGAGKSFKTGKESEITTTIQYPQLWPHSYPSLTNTRRDIKYDDPTLEEFVAGYSQILQFGLPDVFCPAAQVASRTKFSWG